MSHFALGYLLNSLWQVPLVFLCGYLAARLSLQLGPAAQHRVWTLTLILQTLLPACSFSTGSLQAILASWFALHRHSGATVTTIIGPGSIVVPFHLSTRLLLAVAAVYALFLFCVLARFLSRVLAISVLRRSATPFTLTPEVATFWLHCRRHFTIRSTTLAISNRIGSPVTLGLWNNLILLPTSTVDALTAADLQTVLAHESAHIHRHDFAKNLLYEFLALPVSYHPVSWLSRTHLTHTREIVCDQLAADLTGRREYARSLLRLASMLNVAPPPIASHVIGFGFPDAHTFERRLMLLTENPSQCRGVRRALTLAACTVVAFAACTTALTLRVAVGPSAVLAASAPSEPPSHTVKVSAQVMSGNLLTRPNPVYPPAAKEAKIQGSVVLRAIIGKEGAVENLRIVSGPKELAPSALDAVRQWVYKPYLLNGQPTEVETTITVNYSLQP